MKAVETGRNKKNDELSLNPVELGVNWAFLLKKILDKTYFIGYNIYKKVGEGATSPEA